MSQAIPTDSLTCPIPDSSWDQPLFHPTLNVESFTPDYPHYAHPPSLPYSVSPIGSTFQPTNYALGMPMSPDILPENGQPRLLAHQVFELPLTSYTTSAVSQTSHFPPFHVLIRVSLFRSPSLPIIPNLRVIWRICRRLPDTFLFQLGCTTHTTPIWPATAR